MTERENRAVGKAVRKKDSESLLLGRGVYLDDLTNRADCLVVKALRSPHAHALIQRIDKTAAEKVPGVVGIYTWEDVPGNRFTIAGQTYPEPSPYDRLILDRRVRFVGDAAALVAAETEEAADRALRLLTAAVEYEVLPAILDPREAKDSEILVHPEENWRSPCSVGADNRRNLCSSGAESDGDPEAVFASCDVVFTHTYHTRAVHQAMMETFRAYTELDAYGRLHVISSTQIVFHVRRILANALGIPKPRIHVEKPRIGGGFGAKQTAVMEMYPAFVTWKTGRAAKMIYSRRECQLAGSPRHEMEVTVKLGAMNDGTIRALDVYTLSNTGAYGEHGPTTVGLSGHKSIPLYTGSLEAFRFAWDVVYTNTEAAGAYRGYGATQGIFAVESAVNELSERLGLDPVAVRLKNTVREGQLMPAYYGEPASACALDRCLTECAAKFGWAEKYPVRRMSGGKLRTAGVAIAMQGSGISGVDVGSASVKLNDDGSYTLRIGAADMGTGCDTILAQMTAEMMDCSVEDVAVSGADTDSSPYDSGSYASSTTFVTGRAVEKACLELREALCAAAAEAMKLPESAAGELVFSGKEITVPDGSRSVSLAELAERSQNGGTRSFEGTASHSSPTSPPPFMAGMAEIELDPETGSVTVLNYTAAVDCGTVINPALARIQTEGGLVQGIGMTLTENIQYDERGNLSETSFLQYKIPTRLEVGRLDVFFCPSYEGSGPFGAKSIGEIVINTPAPAIVHALYRATGRWFRTLPVTPEQIALPPDVYPESEPEKGAAT